MTCVNQHLMCTGMTHTAGRAVITYKVSSGQHFDRNFAGWHRPDVQRLDNHTKGAMAKLSKLH